MVPEAFDNFFLAMAGADAALLGLLFVAVSINPDRTLGRTASPARQGVAANAFASLIVAFFVSTTALLPGANLGGTGVFMACVGVFTSARLGVQIVRYHMRSHEHVQRLWLRLVRSLTTVVGSLLLYGYLFAASVLLLVQPRAAQAVALVAVLVLVCCGLGLFRAWELLGAPRVGMLAGWLNPLQDPDEVAAAVLAPSSSDRAVTPEAGRAAAPPAAEGTQQQA